MRPVAPARATADTELLVDPTCRQFTSALWELAGGRLAVTPTVADELPGNARGSEGRHWNRVLSREMEASNIHYDAETYRDIIAATKDAAGEWMLRELAGGGSGALVAVRALAPDAYALAREVAARIPKQCFRRPSQANQRRDAEVIGESVALGFALLSTQNLGSIKDERANEWLIREGYVEGPLIQTIANALRALNPETSHEEAALRAVLGASLPNENRGLERDLRAVTAFIERLGASHAKACAVWAEDCLEHLGSLADTVRAVRRDLPVRTRAMEDSRLRATRSAAVRAGFAGHSG